MREEEHSAAPILVIGYGSQLRSDDAVGPRIVEKVAALKLKGVQTIVRHQLTPELSEIISSARAVVFVDATVQSPGGEIAATRIEPRAKSDIPAHTCDPAALLALAGSVFHRVPPAWCVAVPVQNLEIGEELSALATRGIPAAVAQVRNICTSILER
jgi:hydrogenase maturation protease